MKDRVTNLRQEKYVARKTVWEGWYRDLLFKLGEGRGGMATSLGSPRYFGGSISVSKEKVAHICGKKRRIVVKHNIINNIAAGGLPR